MPFFSSPWIKEFQLLWPLNFGSWRGKVRDSIMCFKPYGTPGILCLQMWQIAFTETATIFNDFWKLWIKYYRIIKSQLQFPLKANCCEQKKGMGNRRCFFKHIKIRMGVHQLFCNQPLNGRRNSDIMFNSALSSAKSLLTLHFLSPIICLWNMT